MGRDVTVVVTLDGESPKTAGIRLLTANKTWEKFEPKGADDVFKAKKGSYRVLANNTELLPEGGGHRVGRLAQLNPANVADKATGSGLSDDGGSSLTWKVDGISTT